MQSLGGTGQHQFLLGAYGLGVARTWMLLGGEHAGFLTLLGLDHKQPDVAPDTRATHDGAQPAPLPADSVTPE